MSSFSLYLTGFVIFIAGLAYGAFLLGIEPELAEPIFERPLHGGVDGGASPRQMRW